ncbi:MAG TPA: isoprenyl transferase [Candidatus Deferrimicrobium sp.]|nr:isoprenyl transferase [Candidatus Deferrimicrobium sp.]
MLEGTLVDLKQFLAKFIKTKPKSEYSEDELLKSLHKLPKHVAIIMDGNGRWARKRGLPRSLGHRAGVEMLRTAVKTCSSIGIKVLTVYAFSTENWKRPREEVEILMNLLIEYLQQETNELHGNNVQIRAIGCIEDLPKAAQRELDRAGKLTANNSGLILNLALNYGGRVEILEATRKIATLVKENKITIQGIDEELFSNSLYTSGLPDPDLLIRTSGEMRLSNFLLWQLAYTELYVTDIFWPDFNKQQLLEALLVYQQRDRRYGGLKS